MIGTVTKRPRVKKAPGVHRGHVPPPLASARQRQDLEDFDHLLSELIRQNKRMRVRIERLTKAVTGLGEDQVDTLLKSLRKRVARIRTEPKAVTRRAAPVRRRATTA